jgi:hypothetical protein
MKKIGVSAIGLMVSLMALGEPVTVESPNKKLVVELNFDGTTPTYQVTYDGAVVVEPSALGLKANFADFTSNLTMTKVETNEIHSTYNLTRSKKSTVDYRATQTRAYLSNKEGQTIVFVLNAGDNDVAFRYELPRPEKDNPKQAIVMNEPTSFKLPEGTTTFLSPQIQPMTGWEQTKPSYEEEYVADAPMTAKSKYGVGYTFPCLFHERLASDQGTKKGADKLKDYWVLISETGVTGDYCGSRLSDYAPGKGYQIAYPQEGECNGWGSSTPAISLPGATPWRTITVGESLAPIVETTVPFDVVEPRYEAKYDYHPGRYTWSWLIWQDKSINYDDQVKFIDVAAQMGYEYVLVDNWWDKQIGYERMEKLSAYAQQKGVNLMLWYNSNGFENNAPQTPRDIMSRPIERKKAMAWMQKIGVKGIKVDFFAGDKQHTMQLYEDILSDANDYGLQVIFHGCTLPRGWERLYPNYVGSEAALASENVYFSDYHAKREGFELTMHPFCRNAVASFDWGGVMMNHHMSRDNKSRHRRFTTDVFEMATAITNQCSVNCVEVTPNVVDGLDPVVIDYLKAIPTTWEDTKFIAGYPTRYAVIARQHGGKWYVGGLNGTDKPMKLTLDLPMLKGKTVTYYTDRPLRKGEEQPATQKTTLKVNAKGQAKVTLQPMGGIILVE